MSAPPAPKFSFSLGGTKKPPPKNALASTSTSTSKSKPALAFGGDDDEDAPLPSPSLPTDLKGKERSWGKPKINPKTLVHQAVAPSRVQKAKTSEALSVDASAFEYDSLYDSMKEAERAVKARKEDADTGRAPKYMAQAIASAATRKLDRLRAEEKMLERERLAEGDEYEGKEKFVTQAYKDQMEEVRKAEEEEKEREGKGLPFMG
jgi:coiled-coil domain-containing protein 55